MSAGQPLLLFRRPVKAKPAKVESVHIPSALKSRDWMKSFIGPEVWALIAERLQINHSRRREARRA